MPAPSPLVRRIVLGTAFALALVVSASWEARVADAQTQPTPPKAAATNPAPDKEDAAASKDSTSDTGQHAVVIEKAGKRVRVIGLGEPDREYDSIDKFVHTEPEIAGAVIAVVAIVFLSPVLLIWLVLRHRMRKAQLLNETMVQLAERGVVPPAEAMQALTGGQLPPSVTEPVVAAAGGATMTMPSLLDQARQARKRAAWSDLRKGVLVGAVGLAFTVAESANDGTPGAFGLILLFIGIAYCALWWFETRQISPPAAPSGTTGDTR